MVTKIKKWICDKTQIVKELKNSNSDQAKKKLQF